MIVHERETNVYSHLFVWFGSSHIIGKHIFLNLTLKSLKTVMRRAVKILHVLYKSDTYGKLLQIDQINMISDYVLIRYIYDHWLWFDQTDMIKD